MAEQRTPDELEAEVVRQREHLARTVDQLETKLDVRSRVGTSQLALVGGATAVALVALWWWRRR